MKRALILAISMTTVLGVIAASAEEANQALRGGAKAVSPRENADPGLNPAPSPHRPTPTPQRAGDDDAALGSNKKALEAVPQRPAPDLSVSSIATHPIVNNMLAEGSTLNVDIRVKNDGSLISSLTQQVLISCSVKSGGPVCPLPATATKDLAQVPPGDSRSVVVFGAIPAQPGTYEIKGQPVGFPASSAQTTLVVVAGGETLQKKSALTPVAPLEPGNAKGLKISPKGR